MSANIKWGLSILLSIVIGFVAGWLINIPIGITNTAFVLLYSVPSVMYIADEGWKRHNADHPEQVIATVS